MLLARRFLPSSLAFRPLKRGVAACGIILFCAAATSWGQPGGLDPAFYRYSVFDQPVLATAVQSDGKVVVGGSFTSVTGVPRRGIARVNVNGNMDPSFDPGLGVEGNDGAVYALDIYRSGTNIGKVVIAGSFTNVNRVVRFGIARLNADGSLDTSFNTGTGLEDGNGYAVAIQSDGKVVVGGTFTRVQGNARSGIVRFNLNGGLDTNFRPGTGADAPIYALAVQPDGNIVVGGAFTTLRGASLNGVGRLTSTGGLDPLTSFNPGTGVEGGTVYTLTLQPDGSILLGGDFTTVGGLARNGLARLSTNGSPDTVYGNKAGAGNTIWAIVPLGDGKAVVGGQFTSIGIATLPGIARLNTNGAVDATFSSGLGINVDNGEYILAMALQTNGSVVIAGTFELVDNLYRPGLARVAANGAVDRLFNQESGTFDSVFATAIQPDGKIVLGGAFTLVNGSSLARIARLNADGLLDDSFNPGTGAKNKVASLAVITNGLDAGKILIAGAFTNLNGFPVSGVARLNSNGSRDASFSPAIVTNEVDAVVVQADGRILIAGAFTNVNGNTRNGVARLDPDGDLDFGFDAGGGASGGAIYAMATQADGLVVLGGAFTNFGGAARSGIARVMTNGTLDTAFDPGSGAGGGVVRATALQRDGRILVGGNFTTFRGAPRSGVARLNADGTLDGSFDPGASLANGADIWSLALQTNGQIVLGGRFMTTGLAPASGLARLEANGSLDYGFDPGTGVALSKATVASVVLQPDGAVLVGGAFLQFDGVQCWNLTRLLGGSAVATPPRLVWWPQSLTALGGEMLSFSVKAVGSKPLFYRWRRNNQALTAETNAVLQFGPVSTNNAGSYTIVVSNTYGSVTSAPIVLQVIPTIDLGLSLNAPGLSWTTGGDHVWYGQTAVNHDGFGAAQSGAIGNSQQVSLDTTVPGPGRLSFWWKVSSEDGYDFVEFRVNGLTRGFLTGESGWVQKTVSIPAGQAFLTWVYYKDQAFAAGQDAAWVDEVTYAQSPALAPSILPNGQFQFSAQASAGQRLEIQASTTLTNWTTIAVLTNADTTQFTDSTWTNYNRRFYRVFTP